MQQSAETITDLARLLQIVRPTASFSPAGLIYRGQANFAWGLVPGLFRERTAPREHKDSWVSLETFSLAQFHRQAYPYLAERDASFGYQLLMAQHYGMPTRLLDWTHNPLVALYFAIDPLDLDMDGALYVASGGHTLSGHSLDRASIDQYDCVKIFPLFVDARLIAQSSLFTVHSGPNGPSFTPIENQTGENAKRMTFTKYRIPRESKLQIRMQLEIFCVTRASLFPGLDGIGKDLRWHSDRDHIYGWTNN